EDPVVSDGVLPACAGDPADQRFRGGRGSDAGGRGAVNIAFKVADACEGDAAGQVSKIPISCDADPRADGREIVGRYRLRDREGGNAVAQRVGVVGEPGVAVKIVEVAFQPRNEQARLPVAADLAAGNESITAMRAAAA